MLIRNAQEEPHADKQITVDVSLFSDDNGSLLFYKERHTLITDFMGVASMVIGEGTLLSGNLSISPRFLKMEVDPEGGSNFSINFSEKLSSVPFSQFSEIALKIPPKSVAAVNIAPGNLPLSKLGFPYVSKDNLQNLEEILSSLPSNNGINNIDSIPDDFADYLSEWPIVPFIDDKDLRFDGMTLEDFLKSNNYNLPSLDKLENNTLCLEDGVLAKEAKVYIDCCINNLPKIPIQSITAFKILFVMLANCITNTINKEIINSRNNYYIVKIDYPLGTDVKLEDGEKLIDRKVDKEKEIQSYTILREYKNQKGFRYVWNQKDLSKLQSAYEYAIKYKTPNPDKQCPERLYGIDCSGLIVWLIEQVMEFPKNFRADVANSNANLLSKTDNSLNNKGTLISLIKKYVNPKVDFDTYNLTNTQLNKFEFKFGDIVFFKNKNSCNYFHVGIMVEEDGKVVFANSNGEMDNEDCQRNRGWNDNGIPITKVTGVTKRNVNWGSDYEYKIIRFYDDVSDNSNFECGKKFKDIINNEIYTTVKIGNQCWMKENLRSKKYQTGADIKEVYSTFEWANLVYLNRSVSGAYTEILGGMFYNATAANDFRKICPSGWRLPTQNDWEILKRNGDVIFDESIGMKLKSVTSYCNDSNISFYWEDAKNNTNELNFDALPLGRINADGVPENSLKEALFWSTWENNYIYTRARAARLPLFSESPGMPLTSFRNNSVNIGANIRCIRGN